MFTTGAFRLEAYQTATKIMSGGCTAIARSKRAWIGRNCSIRNVQEDLTASQEVVIRCVCIRGSSLKGCTRQATHSIDPSTPSRATESHATLGHEEDSYSTRAVRVMVELDVVNVRPRLFQQG
jgi:hypothetical protein